MSEELSESDCCGNGCSNCVLDSKPLSTRFGKSDLFNKDNVLHKYRKYELIEKVRLAHQLIHLKFIIADDKEQLTNFMLDCPPGHHIMMRAAILHTADSSGNNYLLRPYSPFLTNVREFSFEILVNLKPNGKMTEYIEHLLLGDLVEFRGPIGTYVHQPTSDSERVLIIFSQGVAIAPTIAIVQSVLDNEEDMTRIYHYSCFENLESIIFRDKLIEFKKFWNFSSKIYLSRQKCDDSDYFRKQLKYKEEIYSHRLESDKIRKDLQGFESTQKEIVICGSKAFQMFVVDALSVFCTNKEEIFVL